MIRGALRAAAGRLGLHVGRREYFDLVERRFYSPIPDLDELPADIFERESALAGMALDSHAHLDFAERHLGGYIAELEKDPGAIPLDNDFYAFGDAHLAYAMVRHLRPRRLIELGSGYSTLALGLACERNAAEGVRARYLAFDPHPPELLAAGAPGVTERHAMPAQEVPLAELTALGRDDVLFVDTSHTVKLGGDVNRVVLDVLPRLAPGVHVHFHDVWLPFEYHPGLVRGQRLFWSEQYLLQAFLCMNPGYEIVFATRAASVRDPDRFRALVPSWTDAFFATSFWIRRVAP